MPKGERPADVVLAPAAHAGGGDVPITFGKYTLTKRLGYGGMAEAFLAQTEGPSGFQKTLVVKRMLEHLADNDEFVRMFQREARLAALLTHTNVVQIYELGAIDGVQFISMEYVDGAALHDLARGAWRNGLSLPLELVCCAIADAALGLAAAHELCDESGQRLGIVHRDISPDNLMMNREGVTKILDFGVAKAADGEKTAAGMVKGKLPYLAPEQVLGRTIDGRTDLYALGVTFYGLVTGKRPFSGKGDVDTMERILKGDARPPWELNPALPKRVNDLILRLLAKEPADRPNDGAVVHDELAEVLSSRRTVAVKFVREFLSDTLASADPAHGARFCHAVAVSPALLAWPRCEGADAAADDAVRTASTMMRGNLVSSEGIGAQTANDRGAAELMTIDAADVEPLVDDDEHGSPSGPTTVHAPLVPPQTTQSDNPRGDGTLPGEMSGDATAEGASAEGATGARRRIASAESARAEGAEGAIGDATMTSVERPQAKKRPVMVAAGAAAAVVLAVIIITVRGGDANVARDGATAPVVAPDDGTAREPAAVDPVVPVVAADPAVPVDPLAPGSADLVPGAPTPPAGGVARDPTGTTAKKAAREPKVEAKLLEVRARAPGGIQWQVDGRGAGAGTTTIRVPVGTTSLLAVDKKRGGRSVVPVVDGVADFGALPRGKIHPRANPYAEVFLGSELLGTTPFPALEAPVGSYTLRFVHDGKQEKRTVEVTKDAVVRVSVSFD